MANRTPSKSSSRGGDPNAPIPKKQMKFLMVYTEGGKGHKTIKAAAIEAGYPPQSADTQGSWILGRPNVKKWMEAHDAELAKRHDITMDMIVAELAKIGFSNIIHYLGTDHNGLPTFKTLDEIPEDRMAAVSEITVDTYKEFEGRGEDREQVGRTDKIKFKLANKVESLVTLAKVLGLMPSGERKGGGDDIDPGSQKVTIRVVGKAMPLPRRKGEDSA